MVQWKLINVVELFCQKFMAGTFNFIADYRVYFVLIKCCCSFVMTLFKIYIQKI